MKPQRLKSCYMLIVAPLVLLPALFPSQAGGPAAANGMYNGSIIGFARPGISPDEFLQLEAPSARGESVPRGPASPEAWEWVRERVDAPRWFLAGPESLAVDGAGHPHLAYGGDALYYTWYDGTIWHYEVVVDSGEEDGITLCIHIIASSWRKT